MARVLIRRRPRLVCETFNVTVAKPLRPSCVIMCWRQLMGRWLANVRIDRTLLLHVIHELFIVRQRWMCSAIEPAMADCIWLMIASAWFSLKLEFGWSA